MRCTTWPSVRKRPRSRTYRAYIYVRNYSGISSDVAVCALTRVEFVPHGNFLISFSENQKEGSICRIIDDIRPLAKRGKGKGKGEGGRSDCDIDRMRENEEP